MFNHKLLLAVSLASLAMQVLSGSYCRYYYNRIYGRRHQTCYYYYYSQSYSDNKNTENSSNGTMNVLYGVGGGGIGLSALVVCLIKNCKKSNSTSVTIIVQPCPKWNRQSHPIEIKKPVYPSDLPIPRFYGETSETEYYVSRTVKTTLCNYLHDFMSRTSKTRYVYLIILFLSIFHSPYLHVYHHPSIFTYCSEYYI